MALGGPITYNGLTLDKTTNTIPAGGGPGSGYRVVSLDLSPVTAVGYLDKAPLRDSLVTGDIYEGGRTVNLICDVLGSSQGDLWDKVEAFIAAFDPRAAFDADTNNHFGFLPLTFRWPTADTTTWSSGYISQKVLARPVAPPTYIELVDAQGGLSGRGSAIRMTLQLLCVDPRKYLTSNQTLTLTSSNQTATHRGNVKVFPVLTITMGGAGSAVFDCLGLSGVGGSTCYFDLSGAASGDVYTIDMTTRLIKKNGDLDFTIWRSGTNPTNPGAILPASASTSLHIEQTTNVTSAILTWTEAWL